ncbi:MAG: TRAP transporter small permease subunit [Bacillota bacterium]
MRLVHRALLIAEAGFDYFLDALALIAAVFLLLLGALVTIAVVSRYFFLKPMAWSIELIEYSLLYVTFLGGAWLLRDDGHVKIDILVQRFPYRLQKVFMFLPDIVGLVVSSVLLYSGFKITLESYYDGTAVYKMLQVPRYLILGVIPFGSFLLFIQFFRLLIRHLLELFPRGVN